MKISKTTLNFATARNVELVVDEELVSFYPLDDDSGEPAFTYTRQDTGLFFKSNVWLTQETKEELPYWIMDEMQLRRLIEYVAPALQN
nr:hypothetical protein [Moritella viscosa]SHO15530.1 Putative uncharacterized protein [Moritella viscosa]